MTAPTTKILFALLLLLASWLRFYALDEYPYAINQDELSTIYDAYSISETGADRSGDYFPLALRGFGEFDYRTPMYSYLSVLPIKVLGFSVVSGRLVGAIAGTFSLILLFLFCKKLVGEKAALLAMVLATFSPWHLLFSRMAHDGAMLPSLFVILILYLWSVTKEKNYDLKYLIALGFSVGFSANAYQSTRLTSVLFSLVILYDVFRYAPIKWQALSTFCITCFVGALPQIIVLITDHVHFFSRMKDSGIQYKNLGDYVAHLGYYVYKNLAPNYLFFNFGEYNNLSIGRLLRIEFLFFYLGLFLMGRQKKLLTFSHFYLYAVLAIVLLPAVMTNSNPHSLRASGFLIIAPLFSSVAICQVYHYLAKYRFLKATFLWLITFLIVFEGFFNIKVYKSSDALRDAGHNHFCVELASKLNSYRKAFSKVWIEDIGHDIHIYASAFADVHPLEFQQTNEKIASGWDVYTKVANMHFINPKEMPNLVEMPHDTNQKELFISYSKFSKKGVIDSVQWGGEKAYFYVSKH